MKINASNLSIWFGIIGGAPAIAWWVSAGQTIVKSLRAAPDSYWPSIFLGLAVLCFVGMGIANAVAHRGFNRFQETAGNYPIQSGDSESQAAPRGSKGMVPTVGLTFRNSWMEYDHTAGRHYPRKLSLCFSNDAGEIHLGIARWIKDKVGLQADKPPRLLYALKNNLGQWHAEAGDKVVYSGNWVKLWVGLDSSVPDSDLKKLTEEDRLGILEIPATISGTAIKLRMNLYWMDFYLPR